jgi:CheY-like chemotaxis protein
MPRVLCVDDFTCRLADAAQVLRDNGYRVLAADHNAVQIVVSPPVVTQQVVAIDHQIGNRRFRLSLADSGDVAGARPCHPGHPRIYASWLLTLRLSTLRFFLIFSSASQLSACQFLATTLPRPAGVSGQRVTRRQGWLLSRSC